MATRWTLQRLFLPIFLIILSTKSISIVNGTRHVTCNSVLKLLNLDYNARLHSHDVKYGSGSGQQSVTATEAKEDANSYWFVKAPSRKYCNRGEPIKCGQTIRLEHVNTKKNLHSHLVRSPLSGKQEVSAYGDSKGDGDSGDHWMVVCHTDYWDRFEPIKFQHVDTQMYLSISGRTYGSPIAGQVEVVCEQSPSSGHTEWQVADGLFINPIDINSHHAHHHTEL